MWSREVEIFVRWEKGEKCIKVKDNYELEKLGRLSLRFFGNYTKM